MSSTYDDYSYYNSQEIQNTNEQIYSSMNGTENVVLGVTAFMWIFILALAIFLIVCNWKVYKKAGRKGWESIIPYYNTYVLTEIAGLPTWYFIMTFIPLVNFVFLILIYIELAKKFGKSAGFGFGLVFFTPIFMAILAFSKNCVYESFSYNEQSTNNQSTDIMQNNVNSNMNSGMVNSNNNINNNLNSSINNLNPSINENNNLNNTINNSIPVQPINMDSINNQPSLEQTQVITKICSNCGSQDSSNSNFCTKCGNKF